MTRKPPEPNTRLEVILPVSLKQRLEKEALDEGVSVSFVVRTAAKKYLTGK